MIIELFGPPGSGKTTFAHSLRARLHERGLFTDFILSYRPFERVPNLVPFGMTEKRCPNAAVLRFSRPVVEILAIARHPFVNYQDFRTTMHLVRLMSPAKFFSSIRQSQYLLRLSHSWYERSGVPGIALFDQGFVQAICSLALLAGVADDALIANALDQAPKSDLLIRIDAPPELLESRLKNRRLYQGTIEKLFELDLRTSLSSAAMVDRLHALLVKQGRSVLRASSIDKHTLDESVKIIEQIIIERTNVEKRTVA